MSRSLIFLYGIAGYAVFLGATLLLFAFQLDTQIIRPAGPMMPGMLIDVMLVALFGLQHSVMARPTFKKWWLRFIPEAAERSTYVWASNVVLLTVMLAWQPINVTLWKVTNPTLWWVVAAIYASGYLVVVGTTWLINHFDLFGLRQVWLNLMGKAYTGIGFRTPGPYKLVRHPLYVGWLMTFWAAPNMTLDRMIFAMGMTAYILIAIQFEERNLAEYFGRGYVMYQQRVPMLIPGLGRMMQMMMGMMRRMMMGKAAESASEPASIDSDDTAVYVVRRV